MKRKRKHHGDPRATKRAKNDAQRHETPTWPLLRYYYPNVSTLRHYLAARLSKTSRKRGRALLRYGNSDRHDDDAAVDESVVKLLDETVVGSFNDTQAVDLDAIEKDITVFTQQLSDSTTTISPTQGAFKQSEIVDFAIWLLFRRHQGPYRPPHLLCQGFQRYASGPEGAQMAAVAGMPGIFSNGRNQHVQTLQRQPWSSLPQLLGKAAERVLSELLLSCGIFQMVEGSTNLSQLSGVPLCDLKPVKPVNGTADAESIIDTVKPLQKARGLSDIRFVRHRMLYARPTLNAKRNVSWDLGPTHVLNRHRDLNDSAQDRHLLKYIFPRQFDLHNVFTSEVDKSDTAQPFKDYTFREQEIARSTQRWRQRRTTDHANDNADEQPLPKRLRGRVLQLIHRLRKRHTRCSYSAMLAHYCPSPASAAKGSLDQAASMANVSAFCRAIVSKVFPADFWGMAGVRETNRKQVMRSIDRFVRMRRYESLCLHDVLQGVQIDGIEWLAPEHLQSGDKMSMTDFTKRQELMAELLYYLFDSFLIPLIRGHFHVTESGAHRNQLFYFRHDVWRAMSEPALASLKETMLEQCNTSSIKRKLATRALGVSRVRLLPKEQGMRPIINLRRRVQKLQQGRWVLGRSINSLLTPTFSVLNHEKDRHAEMLHSALFSVEDMYPRLQAFRQSLVDQGLFGEGKPLYFAKIDVKACFDTVPQKRLMQLAREVIAGNEYHIAKYSRAKLVGGHNHSPNNKDLPTGFGAKPSWKFLTKASAATEEGGQPFSLSSEICTDTADGRTRTIYVDGGAQRSERREALLRLLEEHVECNVIQLGNQYYRQKEGIPQGSIVSSLLCSFFYSELERERLGFLSDKSGKGRTILLRLIDDFLVVSADRGVAERFMRVMHAGIEEFGVEVKGEKSRVNFEMEVEGRRVERVPAETKFAYCGCAIDTVTLDLSKDRERRKRSNIPDSMSVEYSKLPGHTFYRKTLNALKLHMQGMLLSTAYNGLSTVLANLHHAFGEVALKSYYYIRSLPASKRPGERLLIKTVNDTIQLACALMKRRKRSRKDIIEYKCRVSHSQARWLACTAFMSVFQRRQTGHEGLLAWLEGQLALPAVRVQTGLMRAVISTIT